MISKIKIERKQVVFRLTDRVYSGTVKAIENDGIWVDSPMLLTELMNDASWGMTVKKMSLAAPMIYIPNSSLVFLIAPAD